MRPRLFTMITSLEARKLMSYRADFWFSTIATFIIHIGIAWFLWRAIFRESGDANIGGYSFHGMIIYYIIAALLTKIVFGPGGLSGFFSQEIYDGSLNRYLVYPAQYFSFKYAQNLGSLLPVVIQIMIMFTTLLFFIELPEDVNITPATVLMAIISIWFANLLCFLMFVPFELVAFWADNVWSLNVMLRIGLSILGGLMFPLTLLPAWAEAGSRYFPFAYTFHVPVNTLMGRVSFSEWVLGLGVCVLWSLLLSTLIGVIWRRGLLRYSGVGI